MDPADRSLIMAEATNPQQHEPKRAKQSDERADLRSTPRLRPAQECRALIAWSGGQQKVAVVDLSQRETQDASAQFAGLIVRESRGAMPFKLPALQSAAFVVLKSPDVPSVLLETGYINNISDVARLTSPSGKQAFAAAVAQAIKVYFARASVGRK